MKWTETSSCENTETLVRNKDLDHVLFFLRGRKLFGGTWCRQTSAGCSQWQTDEQPPAGAGCTAAHWLPLAVLHMQVCVPLIHSALYTCEVNWWNNSNKLLSPDKPSSTLTETLRTMDLSVLQPFLPGQPKNFANFLDKALGVRWKNHVVLDYKTFYVFSVFVCSNIMSNFKSPSVL